MNENTALRSSPLLIKKIARLRELAQEIASKNDPSELFETILLSMQNLTNADAGSLYRVTAKNDLKCEFFILKSRQIHLGGKSQRPLNWVSLPLTQSNGSANLESAASYAINKNTILNLPNLQNQSRFNFAQNKLFDSEINYQCQSLLTIPIKDQHHEMIGVVQLVNAIDDQGKIGAFSDEDQELAVFLSYIAGATLTNLQLGQDLFKLFESFVTVLASAIDEKSPYTGGHCRRVPVIAQLLAEAINKADFGPHKHTVITKEQKYQLELASLLHDCGKVTTPIHIMDKATKLETIFDRIELVTLKIELLIKEEKIKALNRSKKKVKKTKLKKGQKAKTVENTAKQKIQKLQAYLVFLRKCNIGQEFMSEKDIELVKEMAKLTWTDSKNQKHFLLGPDEVKNLTINKGTLTEEEREVIKNHATVSVAMLEKMHFPKNLAAIPEIAGCHHETMDGRGYPKRLRKEQMSIMARLMGIADIFEALTAADRPYKKGKPLSESLTLLAKMSHQHVIDHEIFEIFVRLEVYLTYAHMFLQPEQIDTIDKEHLIRLSQPQQHQVSSHATESKETREKLAPVTPFVPKKSPTIQPIPSPRKKAA